MCVCVCMYVWLLGTEGPPSSVCCACRPNGFSEGPGGAQYSDRQALAYHIYCPLSQPTALSKSTTTLAPSPSPPSHSNTALS